MKQHSHTLRVMMQARTGKVKEFEDGIPQIDFQSLLKNKDFKRNMEKVLNIGLFDQKIVELIMAFGDNDASPIIATQKKPETEHDHDDHSPHLHDHDSSDEHEHETDRSNHGLVNQGNL